MCFSIDTIYTVTQSSMTIREVHKLTKSTSVRGFPVLAGVDQPFPVGFVDRDEVCQAIGR
jgi:predicted transcriptional regulator